MKHKDGEGRTNIIDLGSFDRKPELLLLVSTIGINHRGEIISVSMLYILPQVIKLYVPATPFGPVSNI